MLCVNLKGYWCNGAGVYVFRSYYVRALCVVFCVLACVINVSWCWYRWVVEPYQCLLLYANLCRAWNSRVVNVTSYRWMGPNFVVGGFSRTMSKKFGPGAAKHIVQMRRPISSVSPGRYIPQLYRVWGINWGRSTTVQYIFVGCSQS